LPASFSVQIIYRIVSYRIVSHQQNVSFNEKTRAAKIFDISVNNISYM